MPRGLPTTFASTDTISGPCSLKVIVSGKTERPGRSQSRESPERQALPLFSLAIAGGFWQFGIANYPAALARTGTNRLAVGVQSLEGRIHDGSVSSLAVLSAGHLPSL